MKCEHRAKGLSRGVDGWGSKRELALQTIADGRSGNQRIGMSQPQLAIESERDVQLHLELVQPNECEQFVVTGEGGAGIGVNPHNLPGEGSTNIVRFQTS